MEFLVDLLIDPFATGFMQRALLAGLLAALTCSLVGTWVVLRGLTFMGDALAHGVLPGIAVAYIIFGGGGVALAVGAAAAIVMIAGSTWCSGRHICPRMRASVCCSSACWRWVS